MNARIGGMTLVEMLVCMGLALVLVLLAISLLLSSRATFTAQDEGGRLTESGQYALAMIERAVRQAGLENWDADGRALVQTPGMAPAILGLDDARLPDMPAALQSAVAVGVNGSDVLAVRYFGSGASDGDGDGRTLNCTGVAVPEPGAGNLDDGRGWSIFHVARSATSEPELRCKTRARNGSNWNSEAIASGVESMQVLYGVDVTGDGLPERFVRAGELGSAGGKTGAAASPGPWNNVVAVRVALLVRGAQQQPDASGEQVFDLFGSAYSKQYGATDHGVQFREADLAMAERKRARRLFALSIPLRSRAGYMPNGLGS